MDLSQLVGGKVVRCSTSDDKTIDHITVKMEDGRLVTLRPAVKGKYNPIIDVGRPRKDNTKDPKSLGHDLMMGRMR